MSQIILRLNKSERRKEKLSEEGKPKTQKRENKVSPEAEFSGTDLNFKKVNKKELTQISSLMNILSPK